MSGGSWWFTAPRGLRNYDSMMEGFYRMTQGEMEKPYSDDYELALYKLVLKCCGVNVK